MKSKTVDDSGNWEEDIDGRAIDDGLLMEEFNSTRLRRGLH